MQPPPPPQKNKNKKKIACIHLCLFSMNFSFEDVKLCWFVELFLLSDDANRKTVTCSKWLSLRLKTTLGVQETVHESQSTHCYNHRPKMEKSPATTRVQI